MNFYLKFSSSCLEMLYKIDVFKNFAKFARKYLCRSLFLTKFQVSATATLLALPVPCWTGDNTDLRLDSNILKSVRVNIALQKRFLKNIQSAF